MKNSNKIITVIFRILLGLALCYAGTSHLTFGRKEFLAQVPGWVPMDADLVVVLSGIVELILGLALIILPGKKVLTGWSVAIFFVLIFPGNISQYVNQIDAFGLNTDTSRLIRLFFQPVLVIWALWSTGAWKQRKSLFNKNGNNTMVQNFYDLSAKNIQGKPLSMKEFEGKTILVVNTASKCGFTPQFAGLENLYQKYKDKNFVILGFPCNQFGNQEPGDEKSISEGCLINYGVTFQMFSKIDVNGENAHPVFQFLKEKQNGVLGNNIKWNFTKFLIDSEGNPVKRFSPITKPEKIDKYLEKLLD